MICNKVKECVDAHFSGECALVHCPNGEGDCIKSFDNRSQVTCEEKGKRYVYKNTRGVDVINYHMDGGVIKQDKSVPPGTMKCDNLIVTNDPAPVALFVELKGVDVRHAFEQILVSVTREKALVQECKKIYARIVMSSAVPRIQTTKEYKALQKIVLSKGGNIKLQAREFPEADIDLE